MILKPVIGLSSIRISTFISMYRKNFAEPRIDLMAHVMSVRRRKTTLKDQGGPPTRAIGSQRGRLRMMLLLHMIRIICPKRCHRLPLPSLVHFSLPLTIAPFQGQPIGARELLKRFVDCKRFWRITPFSRTAQMVLNSTVHYPQPPTFRANIVLRSSPIGEFL